MYSFLTIEISATLYKTLKKIRSFPYGKEGDYLYFYFYDSKNDVYAKTQLCNYFSITQIVHYDNNQTDYFEIEYIHRGKCESALIQASAFSSNNLYEIRNKGIFYNENKKSLIVTYATFCALEIEKTHKHTKSGWHYDENDDLCFYGYDDDYCGNIALNEGGTYQEQISGLNELIASSLPCQLAVAISLGSCLQGLLNTLKITIETPIFHFYGDSSTGKSTALVLAASIWGNPVFGNGILQSWNSTNNALIDMLNNNYGILCAFDESGITNKNLTDFVYSISQGINKARLNKNCEMRNQSSWATFVISSGECSIINECKNFSGITARVIEFLNLKITNSAVHSEKIKSFCNQHYGCIGFEFVSALASKRIEDVIVDEYKNALTQILLKCENISSIDERLSRYYAIISLAARYAKDFLDLKLDNEQIIDLMISNTSSSVNKSSLFQKTYSYINEWVVSNKGSFNSGNGSPVNSFGMIRNNVAFFHRTKFAAVLALGGFPDANVVLKAFKREHKLKCEKDRLSIRTTANNIRVECYAIVLDKTDNCMTEVEYEMEEDD